ncbi:pyroglutamyl-peptidase I [Clostridium thermosuccinogenes]|uniref:Pyrrolidone-carboxylate peptidase n=1 Tax=Clostridium thermosuccinogenes TaxID=84032 RepID=A0A2K2EZN0_9CLOT|nr:pyroglutamyl-peptidase I [Pseudoclostridium thermosuccinogenes]AUS97292.1 pyroglutamyl-peptidase I [Pseudoclostridium thermosuccinogenes]PNT91991.1 pyroglutamyl-peptidase I [Pseudoclostridium thermosuccinogenes]PNT94888.1 pyroglutamyl-peptidase I [Pseudoclostridium thermosuccinogenes]
MKILITAFEPFGGEKVNPALEAMKLLPDKIGNFQILKLELPTIFYKSIEKVWQYIDEYKPDAVISLGQAGGRACISIERVAINVDDASIADNDGNLPIDQPIFEDGENAYFSNLPIKNMVEAIKKAGIPARISNTAGTYVCNHVMYGVLYKLHKENLNIKAGFIHVPFMPEQVVDKPEKPSMSLENIVKAIEVACNVLA